MSTIGGLIYTKHAVNTLEITAMSKAVSGKRSDKNKIWRSNTAGMFCNLLWTTPESKYEVLPLYDSINQCTLSADARIDNRSELIELLDINTHKSTPITDGELILQAYLTWGESCVTHLIGDFAFAIWDAVNEKLFCARDHLGIKPFYYFHNGSTCVFSSTMEAVIIGAGIPKVPRCDLVNEILENNIQTHTLTIFQDIFRLLPAHTLVVEKDNIRVQRYWFPETITMNRKLSLEDAINGFTAVLTRAINDRMRSAYPIGCELSGGLDSSTVLTIAHELPSKNPFYTFSSTYGNLPCDESIYIAEVAKKLGIEPIYSQADKLDYHRYNLNLFYSISKEWPGHGSFLDSIKEFELAQEHDVRVMLTGQGGDHVATGVGDMLTDYFALGHFVQLYRSINRIGWSKNLLKRYLILPFFPEKTLNFLRHFLSKKSQNRIPSPYSFGLDTTASFLTFSQKRELEILFNPLALLWLERNPCNQIAEHFQIECRHPFFDKRVVEYMLALPPWYKFDGKTIKIIIREAMRNKLPDKVLYRPDKAEFTGIIQQQMKSHEKCDLTDIKKYCKIKKNLDRIKQLQYDNDEVSFFKTNECWKILCMKEWFNANFNK